MVNIVKKKIVRAIPSGEFYSPKARPVNIPALKAKLTEDDFLGRCFLIIYLNSPITRRTLTYEIRKMAIRSYPSRTIRVLETLEEMGVIFVKPYEDIDTSNPSLLDNIIIKKHRNLLAKVFSSSNCQYEKTMYYYLSPLGEEILPFVALKFGFKLEEEEVEDE